MKASVGNKKRGKEATKIASHSKLYSYYAALAIILISLLISFLYSPSPQVIVAPSVTVEEAKIEESKNFLA